MIECGCERGCTRSATAEICAFTPLRTQLSTCLTLVFVLHFRFLATGDSFRTIVTSFHKGHSTVQGIVKSVSKAIWTLHPIYMPVYTEQDWLHSAKLFWQCWNFPNCCGAVDGKHIVIQKPPKSGSYFFNYKHTFSINLMAIVDAAYKFISIEVGSVGCNNDSTVFKNQDLGNNF